MKKALVCFFLVICSQPIFASETVAQKTPKCQLSYVTKSDLSDFRAKGTSINTLSYSINKVLKSSFDFANKLDHYTLGLASAITLSALLNTNASLENIKPNAWNEVTLNGRLVYRDSPFTLIPIKGAKMKITHKKKTETLTTGAKGEYSGFFYKWIPYTRFRLFPTPTFEYNQKLVKTMKVPFKIEISSKVCTASTTITRLPLESITFVLSPQKN